MTVYSSLRSPLAWLLISLHAATTCVAINKPCFRSTLPISLSPLTGISRGSKERWMVLNSQLDRNRIDRIASVTAPSVLLLETRQKRMSTCKDRCRTDDCAHLSSVWKLARHAREFRSRNSSSHARMVPSQQSFCLYLSQPWTPHSSKSGTGALCPVPKSKPLLRPFRPKFGVSNNSFTDHRFSTQKRHKPSRSAPKFQHSKLVPLPFSHSSQGLPAFSHCIAEQQKHIRVHS